MYALSRAADCYVCTKSTRERATEDGEGKMEEERRKRIVNEEERQSRRGTFRSARILKTRVPEIFITSTIGYLPGRDRLGRRNATPDEDVSRQLRPLPTESEE